MHVVPLTNTAKSSSWCPLMVVPCPAAPTTNMRLMLNWRCSYDIAKTLSLLIAHVQFYQA